MQICAPDHIEAHPQKTKEVLSFLKKTTTTKNCEVWIYFKDCTLRSDVMFATSDTNIVSLKNMKWNQLSEAVSIFHEERETLTHHEVASGTELIGIINNIPEVNDEIDMTSSTLNANWEHQEKAVNLSDAAIAFFNSLKLLPLCDHILQATDAGPRVVPSRHWHVKDLIAGLKWAGFTGHHTIQDKTKRCYRSSFGWWQSITLGILSTNRSH